MPVADGELVGRDTESHVLVGLVESVASAGAAAVVRGAPGIGKSALLAAARRRAESRGLRTLHTVGVQAETALPFAGLHRLLLPVLDAADELPEPQRRAMLTAFGVEEGPPPERFVIALATLNLLSLAAARSPLFVLVDDARWLDRETQEVLAFVARRLEAEPIVMLVALRESQESPLLDTGAALLTLEPLDEPTARALLAASAPALDSTLAEEVLEEAAGNPLALVELAAVARSRAARLDAVLQGRLPLTERLERTFAAQEADLPAEARTLLLVAAADDGGSLARILAATASLLGVPEVDGAILADAAEGRFVVLDGPELRFRHPLVRSAVYQAAGELERRDAHAALAAVLEDDPDRRAWHLAAACLRADETVAADLDAAAARALRRGATAVAIRALERAAALSESPASRCERLLRGAELAYELGSKEVVLRLVAETERLELGWREQARVAWIRESFDGGTPGDEAQVRSLVELAADSTRAGDPDLALKVLLSAAVRSFWDDPGEQARELIAAEAERAGVDELDPRLVAILAVVATNRRSAPLLERLDRIDAAGVSDPAAGWLLGMAAHALADSQRAEGFFAAADGHLRRQGRLALLAQVLVMRAWTAIHLGNWPAARHAAEEGGRLAAETAQPVWFAGSQIARSLLAGVGGDETLAAALADEAERVVVPQHLSSLVGVLQLARGLTALGAGRHDEAYEQLRRMFDRADPAFHRRERHSAVAYLADAAVHCGRGEEAQALVDEFAALGDETGSPTIRLHVVLARPWLAGDDEAEALFAAAADAAGARWPFLRARAQLGYGSWLRRNRRPAESRARLRAAQASFDALGAAPWSERAAQELRASGETLRRRTTDARDRLSPQELQIAQLAAEGLSNREIGQQLYLSHRTVASHLYRLFPKLGVTSRSQLAAVLARADG